MASRLFINKKKWNSFYQPKLERTAIERTNERNEAIKRSESTKVFLLLLRFVSTFEKRKIFNHSLSASASLSEWWQWILTLIHPSIPPSFIYLVLVVLFSLPDGSRMCDALATTTSESLSIGLKRIFMHTVKIPFLCPTAKTIDMSVLINRLNRAGHETQQNLVCQLDS